MSKAAPTAKSPESLDAGAPPSPGRVDAPPAWVGTRRERLVHAVLEKLANAMVKKPSGETLRFGLVTDPAQLAAVARMRREVYQAKLPYMLEELAADGTDEYDAHSFVFAVWRRDQVVATIRLTRYPYETLQHVPEAELSRWLGAGWDTDYVEWGRLLVDPSAGLKRLSPAIVTYAGLYVNWLGHYGNCFGYTRPSTHSTYGSFQHEQSPFSFRIPHRGEHEYTLVKTAFLKSSLLAAPRWLGALVKRTLAPRNS